MKGLVNGYPYYRPLGADFHAAALGRRSYRGNPDAAWLFVLAGFAGGHLIGVQKWRLLLHASRGRLGYFEALRCYGAGLFATLCLPSIVGGDMLRAVLAGHVAGRVEAAFLSGIMDRAIDIATLTALIIGGACSHGRFCRDGAVRCSP